MFSIGAIRPISEKKTFFIFTRLFRGGESGEYEIKPVLFLYAVSLVAATKTLFKRKEKMVYYLIVLKTCLVDEVMVLTFQII